MQNNPQPKKSNRQWIRELRPSLEHFEEEDEAVLSKACLILERRMLRDGVLGDPSAAVEYLKLRLGRHQREVFYAMFLDTRHRILGGEIMFYGTIDSAEVHPREVVKLALQRNAAAVIIAHNHPSGDTEPSAADRAVTAKLKAALALIDVRLLDHFVVSNGSYTSLAARGWV
ncbi:MAG: DNA repair protein RadC [Alphaproteobacteria bacterium]|nr:MAG: DNA repair protein RadC [Alphaproteobacteria bacterium]